MGRNQVLAPIGSHTPLGCFPDQGAGGSWGGALASLAPFSPPCSLGAGPLCSHGGCWYVCCTQDGRAAAPVISCAPLGSSQLKALQKNYGRLQQEVLSFRRTRPTWRGSSPTTCKFVRVKLRRSGRSISRTTKRHFSLAGND